MNMRGQARHPRRRAWRELDTQRELREFWQTLQEEMAVQPGRFEGSVKRQSDGATFLRAIELGAPSGNRQPIRIFDQLGGTLPATPQWAGDALVLGANALFFAATDDVAARRFLSVVIGNALFSYSQSVYHDGRPDVTLVGLLQKQ
jgi:hypothetical protein